MFLFTCLQGVGSEMNDPFEAYRKSKSYSFIDSRIGKYRDIKLRYRLTTYKLNGEITSDQSQHVKNKMNQSGLDGAKHGKHATGAKRTLSAGKQGTRCQRRENGELWPKIFFSIKNTKKYLLFSLSHFVL